MKIIKEQRNVHETKGNEKRQQIDTLCSAISTVQLYYRG